MSRKHPRIRPNSLTNRDWNALQSLAKEFCGHVTSARGLSVYVSAAQVRVYGSSRKWTAIEYGSGRHDGILVCRVFRATTARAAYLKALFATTTRKP